jgi:hypothetical protein
MRIQIRNPIKKPIEIRGRLLSDISGLSQRALGQPYEGLPAQVIAPVYFGFGNKLRLTALHAQRSDSGRCRGVT